jgi:hypothetical protein
MGYMRIYGLDVKDRTRGENRYSCADICAYMRTARICGADVHNRIASDTLAYDKMKIANQN